MRGTGLNNTGSWVIRIIFANIIIYLLQAIFSPAIVYYFGLTPAIVLTKFYAWQLVTYMFLHGNFFHIFLNMYALMLFGIPVEQLWGPKKFLIYYFFTGIGAGITIFVINLFAGGSGAFVPTIGASGAVFGLLLAFGVLFPDVELLVFFFIPMKAKYLVVLYGGIELMSLLSSGTDSSVSHVGHLGGLLFGLVFFLFTRRRGIEFKARHMRAKMGREVKEREKVFSITNSEPAVEKLSAILEKLQKGGADSISDDEYQFVKLSDILYSEKDGLCVEEDFDPADSFCKKCETLEACLMREIKKYL